MLGMIHAAVLLAKSSSSGSSSSFGYLFLLAGPVFYGYVFFRYRNVGKRHHHESETEATKLNLQQADDRVQSLTGLTNSRIQGANNDSVQGAGAMGFSMGQLGSITEKLNPLLKQFDKQSGEIDPRD